jgi:hypothetical protein
MKRFTLSLNKILGSALFTILGLFIHQGIVHAAYDPSNLISDPVFTNYRSMTASDIQTFLSNHGSGLTNYSDVEDCGPTNGSHYSYYQTYYHCGTSQKASQIIYDSSQAYQINPQVILATLQKEEGLVTDPNPTQSTLNVAMGYGCPSSCNPAYSGFFLQVDNATWQFRYDFEGTLHHTSWNGWSGMDSWYASACGTGGPNDGSHLYSPGLYPGNNVTFYNPYYGSGDPVGPGAGVRTINISSSGTATLYCYTPFVGPYSETGYSGSYNFVVNFENWFGSTVFSPNSITMSNISQPNFSPALGETVSYTASFKNNLPSSITLDAAGIVGRLGNLNTGANRDFGWQGPITLAANGQAGDTWQYTFTSTIKDLGTIYVWPAINYKGIYVHYNNWGATLVSHVPNFTLSQPLTTNASTIYAGQDVTFTAQLKNNESHAINYDAIGIPVKFYDRYNYDATWVGPGVIGPGAVVNLSGTRTIDKPGPFTYWVSDYIGGSYSTVGSINKFSSVVPSPNFSVSAINFSDTNPVKGETLSVSYSVTNNLPVGIDVDAVGVVGRYGALNGQNRDIGWQGPVHFNAGETKTFTGSRTITDLGTHYYWIGVLYQGSFSQYNNWGSTIVSRAPSFSVSGLNFSNNTPATGETLSATFTITNNLNSPVDVDAVGVVGRLGTFTGPNRDLNWQGSVHFNAGETKTFTESGTVTEAGTHYYWIGILWQGTYLQYNAWGSTIVSH